MSGRDRLTKRARWLGILVLAVSPMGCSDSGSEATTTTAPPTTTSSPTTMPATTTTLVPPDLASSVTSLLNDGALAGDFTFKLLRTDEVGIVRIRGGGALAGDDSSAWWVEDHSTIRTPSVDSIGRIVGGAGRQVMGGAERSVAGDYYYQIDGGRWRNSPGSVSDTTVAGLLDALRGLEYSVEPNSSNGAPWLARPILEPEYDAGLFAFESDQVAEATAETTLFVGDDGTPSRVTVTFDGEDTDARPITGVLEVNFALESQPSIEAPPFWVSAESLGFGIDVGDQTIAGVVDLEIPSDWEVNAEDAGMLQLVTPSGQLVTILGVGQEGLNSSDVVSLLLDGSGIAPEVVEADFSRFGGSYASHLDDQFFSQVYAAVAPSVAVGLIWNGPPQNPDLQEIEFVELVRSITLGNGPDVNLFPGETYGEELLQSDAWNSLSTAISTADCEGPEPVWTTVVSALEDRWTEHWSIDACGDIEIYDMNFVRDPNGGTNILFDLDPTVVGTRSDNSFTDFGVEEMARVLLEQPWYVDSSLDVDEAEIASSVIEARQGGCNFYALVTAGELEEEFVVELIGQLGRGTLFYVDDLNLGYQTNFPCQSDAQTDAAFEAATAGSSDEWIVRFFMEAVTEG